MILTQMLLQTYYKRRVTQTTTFSLVTIPRHNRISLKSEVKFNKINASTKH